MARHKLPAETPGVRSGPGEIWPGSGDPPLGPVRSRSCPASTVGSVDSPVTSLSVGKSPGPNVPVGPDPQTLSQLGMVQSKATRPEPSDAHQVSFTMFPPVV